ncbi:hypothetical protein FEM48_Zijuj04G0189000 [Ziziphus jujuba var. spinosa]|uniref:Uncharacterized protein n=1 Tax=Ziziphus jujuba var. spinosa TaxID=714518 RepID=A0A978VLK8_ZIZJJ|nr:hypothetical protein FEM48_Zijuj04G0189000 [Ziziphus jujuba var. spinosa]
MAEKPNGGVYVELIGDDENSGKSNRRDETLLGVLHRLISDIISPDPSSLGETPFIHRVKTSLAHNVPHLHQSSKNTARNVLLWTRRGSPLRALLVISSFFLCSCPALRALESSNSVEDLNIVLPSQLYVFSQPQLVLCLYAIELLMAGTITLLALTGLLVFSLFFVSATLNAIIISLLMSLAAAGGFLALFFACVTAIYIGALSVAVFVISATTISTIIAVLIATGWVGFFWAVWLATKKSVGLAKHSLGVTGSAFSAYSNARRARRHHQEHNNVAD